MQIIPVLDLCGGAAVHAQAGDRERYGPLPVGAGPRPRRGSRRAPRARFATSSAPTSATSPISTRSRVARSSGRCSGELAGAAGRRRPAGGRRRPAAGGALEVLLMRRGEVVVGLETLQAFADLAAIVEAAGHGRVVFSLDLRLGRPMLHPAMPDASGEGTGARPRRPGRGGRRRDAAAAGPGSSRDGVWSGSRVAGDAPASFPPRCGSWPEVVLLTGGTWSACGMRDATVPSSPAPFTPGRIAHPMSRLPPELERSVERQRLAVGRRLAVVLLHLQLQQGQVTVAAPASSSPHLTPRYCASISAVLFGIGSRAQSRRGKT